MSRLTFKEIQLLKPPELQERKKESLDWFRENLRTIKSYSKPDKVLNQSGQDIIPTEMIVGEMYMYMYDAKHKETLPYYDRFPIIFMLERYKTGFLGLNLHYLHPKLRVGLLENLYAYSNDFDNESIADDSVRLGLRYQALATASNLRVARPCVKQYLFTHLDSKIVNVPPSQWDFVPLLPLSKFTSATGSINTNTVYRKSRETII